MISSVSKFIENRLLAHIIEDVRERVSDTQRHIYTIRADVYVRILTNQLITGVNEYNAKYPNNILPLDKMMLRKSAQNAANYLITKEQVYKVASLGAMFGNKVKKFHVRESNAGIHKNVHIDLRVGNFNLKQKKIVAGKETDSGYVLNAMMHNLLEKGHAYARQDLNLDARRNDSLIQGQGRVDFKSPKGSILRAHGSTIGGAKTTIAKLAMAEGFDTAMQAWLSQKAADPGFDKKYYDFVDKTVKNIKKELDAKYKITDFQDMDFSKLKRDIVIEIEFGDNEHNKKMEDEDVGGISRLIQASAQKMVEELRNNAKVSPELFLNLKGSKSFKEKADELAPALIIKKVTEKIAPKNVKKKGNTKEAKRKSNNTQTKVDRGSKGTTRTKKARMPAEKKLVGAKTQQSPLALANIINQYLPQTLRSMMVAPRLVYRTGRFANSAEVTGVYQGSRGGYSADYTYMKNPYQTFEPGFKMGSTYRDPRSIISTAIRNIAQEQMGIKFGQVRRI